MFEDYCLLECDTFLRKIPQFVRTCCLHLLGRRFCHNICKRKLKWVGGRMEGTRHSSDCIPEHNIASNIKMCQCHWRIGIQCLYKSLHFNSWLLLSAIKEGNSHHICHVICLVMSVLAISLINLHEGSGTDCFFGCVGMPLWHMVILANATDSGTEKVPEIYSFNSCCDKRKLKSHTYL
jgi:hypothetical protein